MNTKHYSDKTLIQMIRGDNAERTAGLKYIYKDSGWINLVKATLRKDRVQDSDIKDAIQESIIVLDNHIRNFQYEGKGSLKNYFINICKGRVYSNRRSIKRQVYKGNQEELDQINYLDPEVHMLKTEQKNIIRKIITKIGEPCKTVLILYQLSYSMKEIAAAVQKSESMAKKMSFTCRKKMRDLLSQMPQLLDDLNY